MLPLPLKQEKTQALEQLSLEFEDSLAELTGCEAALQEAQQDLLTSKEKLEHKKAQLIIKGVEGKNNEEREARLRLELTDLIQEQQLIEAEYTRCKLHAEIARRKWDHLRYQLRIEELIKA